MKPFSLLAIISALALVVTGPTLGIGQTESDPGTRSGDTSSEPGAPRAGEANPALDEHSVAICGHLFSLYAPSKVDWGRDATAADPQSGIKYITPIECFAEDLIERGVEGVFFLGDNTRYSLPAEWEFVERSFADLKSVKTFIAGNRDYQNVGVFEQHGGLRNGSVVIRKNKYICLDAKTILNAEDLAFLEREVADHESYDNVFLLTHYFLPIYPTPNENRLGKIDPYRPPYAPHPQYSNWNSKVVPLIAGKVRLVFTGEYTDNRLSSFVQQVGEHRLQYIRNSFGFGRGHGSIRGHEGHTWETFLGDGPLVYLELKFVGEDVTVIPRAVPLPLDDSWYRAFPTFPE